MKKLQELIKRVQDAENRVDDLKNIILTESNSNYRGETKFQLYISKGNCDNSATCINKDVVIDFVNKSIKYEEQLIAKDKKMLEAMELMLGGESPVKQPPQIVSQVMPKRNN